MSVSEVNIWNMALSAAQEAGKIIDPNENTKQANLCRLWYDTARRRSLKAGAWPCATSYARLAVLATRDENVAWDETQPAPGFQYAYALPEGLLAPQYLHDWSRFKQVFANEQRTLVSNTPDAILCYTRDQTVVANWDEGLVLTISSFLGALICKNINGKLGLSDRLLQEAVDYAKLSQTEMANEENVEFEALPSNLVARGYSGPTTQTRYFFPFDSLNGVSA